MDPYIEACGLWEDFHDSLIAEVKRVLADRVPDRYAVRSGERSYVVLVAKEERDRKEHMTQADVAMTASPSSAFDGTSSSATAVAEKVDADQEPVTMRALVEMELREPFIEIRELNPERQLVTTIEVLSPSNKRPETLGWYRYVRKRRAHMEGSVANLVEIDLLRGGKRMPMWDEWPASPYYLLVARKQRSPECQVWPAHFVLPLPEIPVPLAAPDPDLSLPLLPLIDAIYERSRYERDIDYHRPCVPPLSRSDAEWLAARSRAS